MFSPKGQHRNPWPRLRDNLGGAGPRLRRGPRKPSSQLGRSGPRSLLAEWAPFPLARAGPLNLGGAGPVPSLQSGPRSLLRAGPRCARRRNRCDGSKSTPGGLMSRSFARPKDWHALFLGMFAQKYLQPMMKSESLSERRSVITNGSP